MRRIKRIWCAFNENSICARSVGRSVGRWTMAKWTNWRQSQRQWQSQWLLDGARWVCSLNLWASSKFMYINEMHSLNKSQSEGNWINEHSTFGYVYVCVCVCVSMSIFWFKHGAVQFCCSAGKSKLYFRNGKFQTSELCKMKFNMINFINMPFSHRIRRHYILSLSLSLWMERTQAKITFQRTMRP